MTQAFIPGAGLGRRLRPLTSYRPKPLVPLFHRGLAEWAMEACAAAGIVRFAINTHHLAAAWDDFGGAALAAAGQAAMVGGNDVPARGRSWQGCELSLFHEPVLLDTGGGLKNIASWVGDEPLLIHNGDVFSTLPLDQLIAAHRASGLPVTLALRSAGHAKHIALDASLGRVTDIRGMLGLAEGTHLFTGIYCAEPELLELLPARQAVSVIPAFLSLARDGLLGAVILDQGIWLDLGDREAYLYAHRRLGLGPAVHPLAHIAAGASVTRSVVGPGAVVAAGAVLHDCVVWPDSRIAGDAQLDGCIVCSGQPVAGSHRQADL